MKALSTTSPKLATIKVTGRAARKHYGMKCHTDFIAKEHDVDRRSVALLMPVGPQLEETTDCFLQFLV